MAGVFINKNEKKIMCEFLNVSRPF